MWVQRPCPAGACLLLGRQAVNRGTDQQDALIVTCAVKNEQGDVTEGPGVEGLAH